MSSPKESRQTGNDSAGEINQRETDFLVKLADRLGLSRDDARALREGAAG